MPNHLDLLRRIADTPGGLIVPGTASPAVDGSLEDVIARLEALYVEGLIVNVRVVRASGSPQGPIGFSARLTMAGRASLGVP